MLIKEPNNLFTSPFCATGDKNIIQHAGDEAKGLATLSAGFPPVTQKRLDEGGIAPERMDFNGILFMLSAFSYFQQSGGIFQWKAELNYSAPCIISLDGTFYCAVEESGPDASAGPVKPGTDERYWKNLYAFMGGLTPDAINQIIDSKINTAISSVSSGQCRTSVGNLTMTAVADANVFSGQVTTRYEPGGAPVHTGYANYNIYHNNTLIGTLASSTYVERYGGKGFHWGYRVNDIQTFTIERPIRKNDVLQFNLINSDYFSRVNMLAFLSN